jgi:hypothetical protein
MKPLTEKERLTIIEYFFKRKSLYSVVGWLFSLSLLSSLVVIKLPIELTPNYTELAKEYGKPITYLIAYFIGKYFDTVSVLIIVTKIFVIWMCFYFEKKLKAAGKSGLTIKNLIVGWGNTVNNNVTNTKDDEHS